jgi:type IX secretion system PorP/SprF family membrane protein
MKGRVLIYVFSFLSFPAVSQYLPNNAQAYQFSSMFNPAFTGVEEFSDLKLSYRYQWSGFGSNSPKFLNLSFNMRLRQPLDLVYNSMRTSRTSAVQSSNFPKRKRIVHGFGANVFNSKVGIIKSSGGSLNYAFNYPLTKNARFAIGMSALVESRNLQLGDLTFLEPDPFYMHLMNSPSSQVDLSLRAGAMLYTKGYYLGISYLSLVNRSIESSGVALEEQFYRACLQAGFSVNLSASVTLKPSTLVLLQTNNSFSIDYNVKAYLKQRGWLGLTYRDTKSGIIILGMNVNEFLSASYSYDISLGGFQQFNGNSHELVLALRINNFKQRYQYLW